MRTHENLDKIRFRKTDDDVVYDNNAKRWRTSMENYCNVVTNRYVREVQLVFGKQFRSRTPQKNHRKG